MVSCGSPEDVGGFARPFERPVPRHTEVYLWTPRNKLVNLTAAWRKRTTEYGKERIPVNCISMFPKGIISDERQISTPTGHGALLSTYASTKGPMPTMTDLSDFTYEFGNLYVPHRRNLTVGSVRYTRRNRRQRLQCGFVNRDRKNIDQYMIVMCLSPFRMGVYKFGRWKYHLDNLREASSRSALRWNRHAIAASLSG